jgi:NADH dehydrogenase FAD-containing subunit
VLRRLGGQPTRVFRYRDRGSMATIGRAAAVAVIGDRQLSGLVAWLIGFRNRVLVLLEWAWGLRVVATGCPTHHRALARSGVTRTARSDFA